MQLRLWCFGLALFWSISTRVLGADKPAELIIPLETGHDAIRFEAVPGNRPGTQISVEFSSGAKKVLGLNVQSQEGKRRLPPAPEAPKNAKAAYEPVKMEEAYVGISGLNLKIFSRPNLLRYTDEQQSELIKQWAILPPASQTPIRFDFRNQASGVELWLNGSYAGAFPGEGGLRQIRLLLSSGALVRDQGSYRLPIVAEPFRALDIRQIAKPGAMRDAKVSLATGLQQVEGIPLMVADGPGNGDVGVVREMKGSWALEADEHLSRTPFDGMPETLHFSVPQAFYQKAHVLCAVEPDAKKDSVLTVRMTRFGRSGRGDAMTHASVHLPRGGTAPSGQLKRVGSVTYTVDGKPLELPLYLAELSLDPGAILDLLTATKDPHAAMLDGGYLDIDLLGAIERGKPVRSSTSAVHVFGLTLEKSPAELSLAPTQPGNIFYKQEVPETVAVIKAAEAGRLKLGWTITDVTGTPVRTDSKDLTFTAGGESQRQTIPLNTGQPGWYGLKVSVAPLRSGAPPLVVHDAAIAILGPDRRKAGYESPYGVWWFGNAHYGCDDLNVIGPLLHKGGFRKTTFGWTKYTEADFAPWSVTLNQIGWGFKPQDPVGSVKRVADWLQKFPHCQAVLLFHESYGNYLPAELFGEKPVEDAETVKKARKRVETATQAAKLYRENFPNLKLIAGNTSASAAIIASLLRHGFDSSLMDYIGIETAAGQTGMPEKLWEGGPQGAYIARDAARKFGHELPVTGCYEYTTRVERNLGSQRQAEFYVRDVLMGHAYNYQHISPGLLYDAGNAYGNTLWGAGGICRRYPLLYPKPAYVALAAVTSALDQVKFRRKVPTGSLTVYALEFDRAAGGYAYAIWTPRASAELALQFPSGTKLEMTAFYGAVTTPTTSAGRLSLTAASAPQYLVANKPLTSVQLVRQLTEKEPAGFRLADPLNDAARWTLCTDESLTKKTGELPRHVRGDFSVRQVQDSERGPCLELELHGNEKLSDYIGEYGTIGNSNSVVLPGTPHTLGLWVKGNSSWGKVVFEFQDAASNVWRTHGNEWHDWPGELAINFDGWHLIQFPIDAQSPIIYSSPGGRCQCIKGGARAVSYPIKLTKLHFIMNRKALDPTEMRAVAPVIRLGGAGGY